MSQMRKDIFTDRRVMVADGDGVQPTNFHFKKFARETGSCPFCESSEAATPEEVFAIRKSHIFASLRDLNRVLPFWADDATIVTPGKGFEGFCVRGVYMLGLTLLGSTRIEITKERASVVSGHWPVVSVIRSK